MSVILLKLNFLQDAFLAFGGCHHSQFSNRRSHRDVKGGLNMVYAMFFSAGVFPETHFLTWKVKTA